MSAQQQVQHLLDFVDASPSPWHVIKSVEAQLAGFNFVKFVSVFGPYRFSMVGGWRSC